MEKLVQQLELLDEGDRILRLQALRRLRGIASALSDDEIAEAILSNAAEAGRTMQREGAASMGLFAEPEPPTAADFARFAEPEPPTAADFARFAETSNSLKARRRRSYNQLVRNRPSINNFLVEPGSTDLDEGLYRPTSHIPENPLTTVSGRPSRRTVIPAKGVLDELKEASIMGAIENQKREKLKEAEKGLRALRQMKNIKLAREEFEDFKDQYGVNNTMTKDALKRLLKLEGHTSKLGGRRKKTRRRKNY